ncbi:unnamed protein product [Thlaspi arvense]|uniref:MADS-box domain-containing protein n=1 Tax=Thlaspi arvense TaxID=13288 RepID=A0AAU9SET2_THLAR|nr:unnamed protein product [Thlaspi arvense]
MESSPSSSSTSKNAKLSVRSKPSFKKSAFSAAKKITNLAMREQTILKKASELSTLCEIEACVIHYSRDGELVNTWPEDLSKVRDVAERFSRLSDKEKLKKSSNLSQFLTKKMNDEKKRSLEGKDDNKFEQKALEIEATLENHQRILQDRVRLLLNPKDHQTGPNSLNQDPSSNFSIPPADLTTSCSSNQDPSSNVSVPPADLTTSCSLNQDPGNFSIPADVTTSCSLNQHPSNFSIPADVTSLNQYPSNFSLFLYNHDDGTFTQLPKSAPSSFEQPPIPYYNQDSSYLDLLLAEEDMRSCNNSVRQPSFGFPTMLIS